MNRILLVLTIICFSCTRAVDQGKTVTLYSDTTGENIEATVPKDWIDYHALKFEVDDHLSFSSFGNSDTGQHLFVSVSRNIGEPNLKSLIEKTLWETRANDTGVHLTDLKVIDSTVISSSFF